MCEAANGRTVVIKEYMWDNYPNFKKAVKRKTVQKYTDYLTLENPGWYYYFMIMNGYVA